MSFRQFLRFGATAMVVASLSVLSATALAQPGDGVRSENGWELVPALTLSGSYRTNVYRASGDSSNERAINAPVGSVRPKLTITSPESRKFVLDFDGAVQWSQYFGDATRTANQVVDVSNQSGLDTGLNLAGRFNPQGDITLTVNEAFTRSNEPPNTPGDESFNWISNSLGAVVGIRPGAGVLSFDLGYKWRIYSHSTDVLEALDRQHHQFSFESRWRFLPKTAALLTADYGFVRWVDSVGVNLRSDEPQLLTNYASNPLRVQGGLSGLLTRRIAIKAMGGYGWSMHAEGPSFQGVTGTVAMAYTPGRISLENKLQLGYTRDFRIALAGNYQSIHKVFATYDQKLLDGLLTFGLNTTFEMRDYSLNADLTQSEAGGANSLNDEILIGKASIGANVRDWWNIGLAYNIRANFTDDQLDIPVVDPETSTVDVLRDYTQHSVSLGTTVRY